MKLLYLKLIKLIKHIPFGYKTFIFLGYATIALMLSLFLFFYKPMVVSGSSMYPTFNNNDKILVDRFNGDLSEINRGDVIVFYSPIDKNITMVKRVIGVSNDIISINKGKVFINKKAVFEPYKNSEITSYETLPAFKVPKNSVFVLGDNRLVSSDSREWGCINSKYIYGKYILKINK